MSLFLPSLWVYVWYADGTCENVANTDTLTKAEADAYAERWEKAREKPVVRVSLGKNEKDIVKEYHYHEEDC